MSFRCLGSALPHFVVSVFVASWSLAYATEGELDTSFGTGGKSSADITGQRLDDAVGDVALLPDGRILVAGTTSSGFPTEHDLAVVIFAVDGSVDETFGQAGRLLIDQGGDEYCYAVAVQPDGCILLGGYRTAFGDGAPQSLIVRLDPYGALDTSFGILGVSQPALPFAVVDLAVLPDGALIVAGSRSGASGNDFALARFDSNGFLEETFGEGGIFAVDFGGDDYLTQLSVDPAGRLLAVGLNTSGAIQLVRLFADGSPDATFHGTGRQELNVGCFYDASVAVQANGKILVGTTITGSDLSDFLLARLNEDGSLDPSFGSGGFVTDDLTGTDDYLAHLTLEPDGKIIAAGWAGFYPDFLVQRYTPDGSVDQGFGLGGWVHTDFIGDKDRARVAIVQPDGRVVLAGDVPGSDVDESRDFGLVRYEFGTGQQSNSPRVTRSVRASSGPRVGSIR